ncbi:two pore domain potassium channel family protein [Skermania sp. ID1734]|uniref:ion channel n=1 Tax=Skermania sp. ID1734 TaxID=2597516 RepID=UPI00117D9BEF|nr:ion channel [Skermania sp. ID1734]TSE00060.1 two pore domain potassium channel family protein [Skermania sp. ID1734]
MLAFLAHLFRIRQQPVRIRFSPAQRLRRSAAVLFALLAAHVTAMMIFEHSQFKHGLFDAIWLTLTTVVTVGYGDIAPHTVGGRLATMVLLYAAAVFMAANIASLAVELRMDRIARMRDGKWKWNLKDHLLIIHSPEHGAERYFVTFLRELRADPDFHDIPVMILTDRFTKGLPESVHDLGAVYYNGSPHNHEALRAAGAETAAYVVLLAEDECHSRSDSINFNILLELHELYSGAKIIAEVVEDTDRERFFRFGAHRIIRPSRAYPEFAVRAITCPGSEVVVESMLQSGSGSTRRYNVRLQQQLWSDVAAALLTAGYGTALGYVNESRRVISNPAPNEYVTGRGLLLLTPKKAPSRSQVQNLISGVQAVGARP